MALREDYVRAVILHLKQLRGQILVSRMVRGDGDRLEMKKVFQVLRHVVASRIAPFIGDVHNSDPRLLEVLDHETGSQFLGDSIMTCRSKEILCSLLRDPARTRT